MSKGTPEVLREFAEQLRGPKTASMYRRIETPDGPMHVFEPIELGDWCGLCGESIGECDCIDIGGES